MEYTLDFIAGCLGGSSPSVWKFYENMDDLLGVRPNARTLEFGIDMDTSNETKSSGDESDSSESSQQTGVAGEAVAAEEGVSAEGAVAVPNAAPNPVAPNPVALARTGQEPIPIKRRKKTNKGDALMSFMKSNEEKETERQEKFLKATQDMMNQSTKTLLTGIGDIFRNILQPQTAPTQPIPAAQPHPPTNQFAFPPQAAAGQPMFNPPQPPTNQFAFPPQAAAGQPMVNSPQPPTNQFDFLPQAAASTVQSQDSIPPPDQATTSNFNYSHYLHDMDRP